MLAMDFSPRRFSTGVLPERARVRAWCAEFGRTLLRVNIEPLTDLPFHAEAELRALLDVRVLKGRSSAVHFQRTRAFAADGNDSIAITVSNGGAASQRGRNVALRPGDGVALLGHEPADVVFSEGSRLTLLFHVQRLQNVPAILMT
jgi:hypothetical protein